MLIEANQKSIKFIRLSTKSSFVQKRWNWLEKWTQVTLVWANQGSSLC